MQACHLYRLKSAASSKNQARRNIFKFKSDVICPLIGILRVNVSAKSRWGQNLNFTHVFTRACKAFEGPSELGDRGTEGQGDRGTRGPPPPIMTDQLTLFQPGMGQNMPTTLLLAPPPPHRIYRPSYGPSLLRNWSKHGLVPRLFMRSFRLHP